MRALCRARVRPGPSRGDADLGQCRFEASPRQRAEWCPLLIIPIRARELSCGLFQALLAQAGYTSGPAEPGAAGGVARPPGDGCQPASCPPGVRLAQAKALNTAGMLADEQGDY